jgi:hypothetical protein
MRREPKEQFELSVLWQTAFLDRENDQDATIRAFFRGQLLALRGKVAILVEQIAKDCPDLTLHDIRHLDALWEIASLIAGTNYQLNPAEGYVLGAAILLHDVGLTLASYPGRLTDIKKTNEWRDTVTAYLHDEGIEEITEKCLETPPEQVTRRAVPEVLRCLHAKRALDLPLMQWPSVGKHGSVEFLIESADLRNYYGGIIGKIAQSHHESVRRLPSLLGTQINAISSAPSQWTVDPVIVACLLRVADAANLDARRAPRFLRIITRPEGLSGVHWDFQSKMGKPRVEGGELIFSAGPDFALEEADAWWLCFDSLNMVDHELGAVDLLLKELHQPRFAARRVRGVESPGALSRFVRTRGWEPVDARLRVSDIPNVIRSLGGTHLYGNEPRVPIRELIQNAADAIMARRLLQPLPDDYGRIIVRIVGSDENVWLEVEDNGTGMSAATLTGPLLDFGKSFWAGDAVRTEFPGLIAKGMKARGRFGIGFFSTFMLGDIVGVTSRRYDAAADSTWILDFRAGLDLRPILRRAGGDERLADGGSKVSVKLRRNPFTKGGFLAYETWQGKIEAVDFARVVGGICPNLDMNVSVEVSGTLRHCVGANDWIQMGGIEVLFRLSKPEVDASSLKANLGVYGQFVRPLADGHGRRYGRACVIGKESYLLPSCGVVSVGGLAAVDLRHIGGILLGDAETAARNMAVPLAPPAVLAQWATEQATLIAKSKLSEKEKLRAAGIVMHCGGNPGRLPVVIRGREYVNSRSFRQTISEASEIRVFQGEEIDYDEDMDDCHPKEFKADFLVDRNLFLLSRFSPVVLNVGSKRWPECVGVKPLSYEVCIRALLRKAWGSGYNEATMESAVGEVNGSEIRREVLVFSR